MGNLAPRAMSPTYGIKTTKRDQETGPALLPLRSELVSISPVSGA
jgi:hypothetical protein